MAEQRLIYLDDKAFTALMDHADHPDPEIRLRIRFILVRYQNVSPRTGDMPLIWFLPHSERYQLVDGMFMVDMAKKFYEEGYIKERDEGGGKSWPNLQWGVRQDRTIFYEFRRGLTYKLQDNTEAAITAMQNYIKWRRMQGTMSKRAAQDIIEQTQKNMTTGCFVVQEVLDVATDSYLTPDAVPSCMLKETVYEGMFWTQSVAPKRAPQGLFGP